MVLCHCIVVFFDIKLAVIHASSVNAVGFTVSPVLLSSHCSAICDTSSSFQNFLSMNTGLSFLLVVSEAEMCHNNAVVLFLLEQVFSVIRNGAELRVQLLDVSLYGIKHL